MRRKPNTKPIADATDALFWRATILCEMLEGIDIPGQVNEPIRRMKHALADYEASRIPASELGQQLELRS